MRIELPSGAWVEVKDNTLPGDRWAVLDAPEVALEDGKTVVSNAAGNQRRVFLARIITAWSYDVPIPAVAGAAVLNEYPNTDDDIDALEDALDARYERIVGRRRPNPPRPQPPTSGTSSAS